MTSISFNFARFESEVLNWETSYKETLGILGALGEADNISEFYNKLNKEEKMEFDERAAIIEFDGKLNKDKAERQAMKQINNSKFLVNGGKDEKIQ